MTKYKYYYYGAGLIGTICLILSYLTIYNNLKKSVGMVFALAVPFSTDILIVFLTFAAIQLIFLGKKYQAQIIKYISYSLMLLSIYYNVLDSFSNNNVNYPSLISHSGMVVGWIICAEVLVIFAKDEYFKKVFNEQENSKLTKELNLLEHNNKLEIIKAQHNKQLNKVSQDTSEINIKARKNKIEELKYKKELTNLNKLVKNDKVESKKHSLTDL